MQKQDTRDNLQRKNYVDCLISNYVLSLLPAPLRNRCLNCPKANYLLGAKNWRHNNFLPCYGRVNISWDIEYRRYANFSRQQSWYGLRKENVRRCEFEISDGCSQTYPRDMCKIISHWLNELIIHISMKWEIHNNGKSPSTLNINDSFAVLLAVLCSFIPIEYSKFINKTISYFIECFSDFISNHTVHIFFHFVTIVKCNFSGEMHSNVKHIVIIYIKLSKNLTWWD